MKLFKKMKQVVLATFFFGLLGTSTVFADDSEGWQFVQENGRTYYKKGDLKETYWRVIDGKYYYFDPLSGEMVVGWQYIPAPHKGVTIGPSPRQEIAFRPDWFYFGQDGVLQEFVGKQVLEAKTATNTNKHHGEEYDSPAEKRVYYFEDQRSYHTLKTGWVYDDGDWYYLQKDGGFDSRINRLTVGELARGWVKDYPLTYDEEKLKAAPWYYLRSSGAMATGWYQDGSTWYYLDAENGDMRTGWQYLGNKWYYLRSSGAMATGWYQEGSTWYYLNASNGDMKTGWFQVNGNWYYTYDSGALAVNTTVGGYYLNYNGEWVK
ncbi:TPA: choline-binding protein CbpF [Streptococcus pneumoniae]|nr:choline-binding protein CbpF [Streptococcus pneumoniae]